MTAPLAIVVPAFKGRFFEATLRSIAAQTRRDFVLYVGDDASPDDLGAICRSAGAGLDLRYTRFETNLGRDDLVSQWMRCVALSSEPWVWLFGDDDLMPPDAVARLLRALPRDSAQTDLLHFDVDTIDAQGNVVRQEPRFPPRLGAREFLRRRLRFELSSFAPDYVFARDAFERVGGFVRFPRAWCADDATWALLASRGGICTLPGAPVQWRHSGDNISASHDHDAAQKAEAQLRFVAWMVEFLRSHAPNARGPEIPEEPDAEQVLCEATDWFFQQLKHLGLPVDAALTRRIRAVLGALPGNSSVALSARIWRSNVSLALRQRRARARRG